MVSVALVWISVTSGKAVSSGVVVTGVGGAASDVVLLAAVVVAVVVTVTVTGGAGSGDGHSRVSVVSRTAVLACTHPRVPEGA